MKKRTKKGSPALVELQASLDGPSIEKTEIYVKEEQLAARSAKVEVEKDKPGPDASDTYRSPKAVRIERDGAEPLVVSLHPDKVYVFGRAPESSVVFPSDAVSRLHAQLRFASGRWVCRDLNSSNGTYLVSTPVSTRGDPRRSALVVAPRRERSVQPGDTLLLANKESRLAFLEELPDASAVGSRPGARRSPATERMERSIEVCARHRLPVFLLGPSGCGKTFVARAIHDRARMQGHFVILNCGRLPQDSAQLASELLGHVRGAFTGAIQERKGQLWSADQGTLFLDEVESLPRAAQDFLIDVLEGSGSYDPYGSSPQFGDRPPRFRLISASKVPLGQSGLRPDLCQRLAAGDVFVLPTLEERRSDIPALAQSFVAQLHAEQRIDAELTPEALRFLQEARWPGEIRELQSTVKVVISRAHADQQIDGTHSEKLIVAVVGLRAYLQQRKVGWGDRADGREAAAPVAPAVRRRPSDLTAELIRAALADHRGNKTQAADSLGIALNTFKSKLRQFRVDD